MAEYTYDQVMQAARNADAAGDTESARQLVQKAKAMPLTIDDSATAIASTVIPSPAPNPEFSETEQQMLSKPSALAMEFVSSVNRGAINLLDVALSPLRLLTISHPADPFSTTSTRAMIGSKGAFAGQGLGTDIAAASGQLTFDTVIGGAVFRGLSQTINTVGKVSPTGLDNILETLGKTTFADDAAMGFTSGVGGEVAANIEKELLETDGSASRLIGQIVSPAAWVTGVNVIQGAARRYLNQATPNLNQIKGAATALYQKLDEAGIVASDGDTARLLSSLKEKMFNQNISTESALNTYLNKLIKAGETNTLSWSLLDTIRSDIRTLGRNPQGKEGVLSKEYVDFIDEMILTIKPGNPGSLGEQSVQSAISSARQLWRKYKAAETLDNAFEQARINTDVDKTDYVTNLRAALKPLISQDKYNTFTKAQREQIKQVASGGRLENSLRLLSSLGIKSDDYMKAMLYGGMGSYVTGGTLAAGGGVALTAMGISRAASTIANSVMTRNAAAMRSYINVGNDAEKITKIYLQSTKPADRNFRELTALLLSNSVDEFSILRGLEGSNLKKLPIVSDALALSLGLIRVRDKETEAEQASLQAQMPN